MIAVSAILLGAGESKRMGLSKLALPWGNGTVLEHCLQTLLRANVKEIIVVLGGPTKGLKEHLRQSRVKVVVNSNYRKGMGTSIRRGLRAADLSCHGLLIVLGDQPLIKTRTVNALIRALHRQKGTIIVPTFESRRGHPVLFDRRFKKELENLRGDEGGRSLLEKYRDCVVEIRVKSAAVLKDIDTWRDYQKGLRSVRHAGRVDKKG